MKLSKNTINWIKASMITAGFGLAVVALLFIGVWNVTVLYVLTSVVLVIGMLVLCTMFVYSILSGYA